MMFMEGMLSDLEGNSHHAQKFLKSTQFTVDMLCYSVKEFIQEECRKIARHREYFSSQVVG